MAHYPHHTDELWDDSCRCRTADAPVKVEDKDRGQYDVADHRNHWGQHGFLGITGGAHHIVQPDHRIGNGSTQQDHLHKVPRIGQGVVAGPEETQDLIQEEERDAAKQEWVDQAEHQGVVQHFRCPVHIFLPQPYGRNGRTACRNQCTESNHQVHQRESNGKSGNTHGAYAMTDKYTVDDIVQWSDCHSDNGRNRILYKKLVDSFGS